MNARYTIEIIRNDGTAPHWNVFSRYPQDDSICLGWVRHDNNTMWPSFKAHPYIDDDKTTIAHTWTLKEACEHLVWCYEIEEGIA